MGAIMLQAAAAGLDVDLSRRRRRFRLRARLAESARLAVPAAWDRVRGDRINSVGLGCGPVPPRGHRDQSNLADQSRAGDPWAIPLLAQSDDVSGADHACARRCCWAALGRCFSAPIAVFATTVPAHSVRRSEDAPSVRRGLRRLRWRWGAGCEARAGKGASNRERKPVKRGDLRRGRPVGVCSNRRQPRRIAPGETFAFFAATLRTERKTIIAALRPGGIMRDLRGHKKRTTKSWAGGSKSRSGGRHPLASPDHALGGRASSGRRARKRNRFNEGSRTETGSLPRILDHLGLATIARRSRRRDRGEQETPRHPSSIGRRIARGAARPAVGAIPDCPVRSPTV